VFKNAQLFILPPLAFIVKGRHTFSTFGFLPTHKPKEKIPKELNFASALKGNEKGIKNIL